MSEKEIAESHLDLFDLGSDSLQNLIGDEVASLRPRFERDSFLEPH